MHQTGRNIIRHTVLILVFLSAACTPKPSGLSPGQNPPQLTATSTLQPAFTPRQPAARNPRSSATSTLAPSSTTNFGLVQTGTPLPAACSPLQGLALSDLPAAVTNPFAPPPLGSDDPHQGVDLADRLAGSQVAVEGRPVQVVFPGQVAGVIADRFPYGNAVFVETLLRELPPDVDLDGIAPWLGGSFPTPAVRSALTCPSWTSPASAGHDLSLYLLYAHLQQPPELETGAAVICGEVLGAVGSTGNALNPHLHLEARIGPSGSQFNSMAHYDTRATVEEMANYCAWRTSGKFIPVDPMQLLATSS